jgi:hypothetical protein
VVEIGERQNKEQDYRDRILANLKAKKAPTRRSTLLEYGRRIAGQ